MNKFDENSPFVDLPTKTKTKIESSPFQNEFEAYSPFQDSDKEAVYEQNYSNMREALLVKEIPVAINSPESPFTGDERHSNESGNTYLSDEAHSEQIDTEISGELDDDLIADEIYEQSEDIMHETEHTNPSTSKELWELMGESIEYDVQKAGTSKDITEQVSKYFRVSAKVITGYDWAFQRAWSERFKELVEWAAGQVNLNPGLVAANFIAETKATDYLGGTISSFVVGTDDFYDKRADLEKKVAAYKQISWKKDSAYLTDVNERGRTVNTVYFKTGKDAALASAVCLKHGEEILREEATKLGKNFDDIPLERCFAFLRLAFNAGNGRAKQNLNEYFSKNQDVLILRPQPKAGPQRMATIRTAQAIYLSETFFAQPLNLVLKETNEVDQQMESYSQSKEHVNFEELVSVVNPPACSIKTTKKNKIKFEFDMLVNMTNDLCITRTIDPDVHKSISEHTRKKEGFKLKIDGNKIEVNTREFKLTDAGKAKLIEAFKNINNWITDMKSAFVDKANRKLINIKKGDCAGCPKCLAGKGISIETTKVGKTLKIKDEFIAVNHFIFPLKSAITRTPEQFQDYFIDRIDVRAVPQVTMGVPLSSVSKLVDIICENKAGDTGVVGTDLTGGNKVRIGVRSDYLFNAQYRVNAARAYFLKTGTFGSLKITSLNFSDSLTGFMILLIQYLWISVLRENGDKEDFAKACVPLHSKTRFREMFHCLLKDEERELFIKVFWENDNWKNLFSLAKNIKQKPRSNECFTNTGGNFNINDAPDFKLFPQVNRSDYTNPTWREFIASIVENNHSLEPATGPETLVTWPTQAYELKSNGVFLEFRRMGFGTFSSNKWQAMAERLFEIARKLN